MNERLMFRIWDKQQKKYLKNKGFDYIDYAITTTGDLILIASENSDYCHMYLDKDKCVIEQCTGLRDKNGKLIYEGDIVKKGSSIAEVYWDAPCYTIRKKDGSICWLWTNLSEVVGNIHENPELLEE